MADQGDVFCAELDLILLASRAGRVIRGKMLVGDALRRVVSEEGILFVRLGGQLRSVPPLCAQLIARG